MQVDKQTDRQRLHAYGGKVTKPEQTWQE